MNDMWQRQQKKTFTAWVNSHLRKAGLHVDEVTTDLCDGKLLLKLLEIISEETLPRPEKGKMKIHKIQNIRNAFDFIKAKGVKLVSIGPEEINDGNEKMILGMLWTLILRFEIQDISLDAMSAKDALLLWCQRKTEPYDNVNITNFHMSWKDGLAFNALIHRHRPELIKYDSLEKENARENFETAFTTADKQLDIPPMLDIDDMIDCVKPDERSVMTQVAAYYKAFASSNKSETAARKIATVLETNREHERLIEEYEEMSSQLLGWIEAKVAEFGTRDPVQGVDTCQQMLEQKSVFRSTEYPTKLQEKGELEAHYSTLQTKLRLSGRPGYVPSEGRLISDIQAAWGSVTAADAEHQDFIVAELNRNRLAESKAESFGRKADAHEAWTGGKDAEMSTDDYSSANLAGVIALKKKHEAFQSDLAAHELRVHAIGTLANELDGLAYHGADSVNDRYAAIYENWQSLVTLSEERQAALDAAEAEQQRLDALCVQYGKEAPPFSNFLDIAAEQLTEPYIADTEADAAALREGFDSIVADLPAHETEFDSIKSLQEQIGGTTNPYSPHLFDELASKWTSLQTLITERQTQLEAETETQAAREQLRVAFAADANAAYSWLTAKDTELLELIETSSFDSIEAQRDEMSDRLTEVEAFRPTLEALEARHAETQEQLIFSNPHTSVTVEQVRGSFLTMTQNLQRNISELGNQILARDSSNISDKQMKEYKESFAHFDKNGNGYLDRIEFRACLLSIGYDVPQVPPEDGSSDAEFERVMSYVDPNGDSRISFDEFITFMTEELADAGNSSELLAAFEVLAGGNPYVMAADLERELAPELYEYCVANMTPYEEGPEGALDFASFASALYGESDL